MTEVLVLIVLVWAGMLVSGALRSRSTSPHVTVGGFERAMDVLRNDGRVATPNGGRRSQAARHSGRRLLVPGDAGRIVERPVNSTLPTTQRLRGEDPLVTRRRMWFERSLAATGVALLAALVFGGVLWVPALLLLTLSGAYVAVLRRLKLQRDEARRVVRELELDRDDVRAVLPPGDLAVGGDGRQVAAGQAPSGTGSVRLRRWGN